MSKFRPDNHVVGKVYDLTQENMNALIEAFESLRGEVDYYRRRDDDASDVIQGYKKVASEAAERVTELEKAKYEQVTSKAQQETHESD